MFITYRQIYKLNGRLFLIHHLINIIVISNDYKTTVYFYIRVSTDLQNCADQRFELETFTKKNNIKADEYIEENISFRKLIKSLNFIMFRQIAFLTKYMILLSFNLLTIGRSDVINNEQSEFKPTCPTLKSNGLKRRKICLSNFLCSRKRLTKAV